MGERDIDDLRVNKTLLSFDNAIENNDFGIDDMHVTKVMSDVILAEFIDATSAGEIMRNGILVPSTAALGAWRKAKVLIVGKSVQGIEVGDIVLLPGDKGIHISNVQVLARDSLEPYTVMKGLFISEDRVLATCSMNKVAEG
tara:strand:- start:17036 stop:17461 length:426 start_codon:yes stop_codon:yes gene_type:complete